MSPSLTSLLISRSITVMAFLQMFNATKSSPNKVAEVWIRLLRDKTRSTVQNSRQPVSFVMATLYKLHIETFFNDDRPQDLHDVDGDRRKALKRFDRWIPCECNRVCEREWCFVNDIGIWKGGKGKCDVVKYLRSGDLRNALVAGKDGKILETMREKWAIPRHLD